MNIMTKIKIAVLLIGDIIILYFALYLTLWLRYWRPVQAELWNKHWLPFTIIFIMWLIVFFINKMYDLKTARNNFNFYKVWFNSLIWCGLIGFIFFYITTTGISPKTVMVLDLAVFGGLFLLWRRLFNRLIVYKKFVENMVIIGLTKEMIELAREINSKPQMGLRVVGMVSLQKSEIKFDQLEIAIINDWDELKNFFDKKKVRTIILGSDAHDYPDLISKLYESLELGVNILDRPTFAEKFTSKILINTIGQMWFLENIKESNKQIYEIIKRVMDIMLSCVFLIITLPLIPLIYLITRLTSKGPGFFMQQRTGKNGKKFMAVKFRTMYQNAESHGPQWAQKNDPRVTSIGRILRKIRIDEIPQLINILRGEMSFIGPRPERPEFIGQLKESIPFYETRLLVKPGLTGWAQINFPYGATEADALEKLQYDLYYIKNRSFALDLSILLKTIKTVISGGGQ
ncbi:sugar transferase [Candidatus Kuenenbacteria bacterium]|nr:sugar transferase [Candidatus Kuenenbacteria bacterium]